MTQSDTEQVEIYDNTKAVHPESASGRIYFIFDVFGAGNLIFPPDLAARAGAQVIPAMAGFLISAVGLPVLGVAAVAVSGGLEKLAGKVGGRFSLLFTLTAYLAIGPFLAIPRTASTSFEMTLLPVLSGAGVQLGDYLGHTGMTVRFWAQLGYSFVFLPLPFFCPFIRKPFQNVWAR